MMTAPRLFRRIRALLTANRHDDEMDEELRFHIEMETAKRVRAGMSEREAYASTMRDLGNVPRHLDDARDARGVRPIEDFFQDVRVAARTLGRQRTFAIVAILTLAIGIGSTTALWSAVYRVLFEPYPFVEAHRIVSVQQVLNATDDGEFAPANFIDVRQRARSFDMLAAQEPWSVDWVGPDGPEVFEAALVTQDAFPIQGLRPIIGRAFVPDEFVAGRDQVALLSESLWRGRFGADSSIVGRTLVLDTIPRVIVGVMPQEALAPYGATVWLPKIFRPDDLRSRGNGYWSVIGRLAPGVTIEQAKAEMRSVGAQLVSEFPAENRGMSIRVISLRDAIVGNSRGGLLILLASVFFVLLIACVNVTSLQLAESVRRRRELAVRTAIGAGRGRLVRQLLAENLLLAFIGASAGLLIAKWGISVIRILAPDTLWQLRTLTFGQPALLFAFAVAVVTALVVAMVPVFSLGRLDTTQPLAGGARSGVSLARRRANRVLVVSEVALALMLLVGAGLLVRSLATLLRVDRGFRTDHVLVVTAQTWSYYATRPLRAEFVRQTVERLGAIPGIERVGMTSSLPLSYPIGFERPRVTVEGQAIAPGDEVPSVITAATTPGYFGALDIPLRSGRHFSANDNESAPSIAIVNHAFVRRYFPNTDPLGKRISLGFMGPPAPREIVGVVGDIRHEELHSAPEPTVYVPHPQAATGAIHFVMRTTGDPAAMERRVREELRAINGSMPLSAVRTMQAQLSDSLRQRRFQLGLLAAFSLTALVLAAIGIYGVMSRATSERTHEIGLRMAVGARATDVRWMVLRNGGSLAAIGIAIGAVGALLLTRYLSGMLFGVSAYDPITYLLAGGVLLATAVLATWLPAWRASTVDPVVALRSD
jgi:putative ABC transport system permease protein